MKSLSIKSQFPQLRCLPFFNGSNSAFEFVRFVRGRWVPCSRKRTAGIIAVMNRRGAL